jgi:hypothetical protein
MLWFVEGSLTGEFVSLNACNADFCKEVERLPSAKTVE